MMMRATPAMPPYNRLNRLVPVRLPCSIITRSDAAPQKTPATATTRSRPASASSTSGMR